MHLYCIGQTKLIPSVVYGIHSVPGFDVSISGSSVAGSTGDMMGENEYFPTVSQHSDVSLKKDIDEGASH